MDVKWRLFCGMMYYHWDGGVLIARQGNLVGVWKKLSWWRIARAIQHLPTYFIVDLMPLIDFSFFIFYNFHINQSYNPSHYLHQSSLNSRQNHINQPKWAQTSINNSTRTTSDSTRERRTAIKPSTPVRFVRRLKFDVPWANNQTEDERSIANKLAREEQREHEPEEMSKEDKAAKQDATLPVSLLPLHPYLSLHRNTLLDPPFFVGFGLHISMPILPKMILTFVLLGQDARQWPKQRCHNRPTVERGRGGWVEEEGKGLNGTHTKWMCDKQENESIPTSIFMGW